MSKKIIVKMDSLTDAQKDAFVEGWKDAGGDTSDLDAYNPCPWCCPWEYTDAIAVTGDTPEEWGASWWQSCRPYIEDDKAEEEMPGDC